MGEKHPGVRGRGTAENPINRFEPLEIESLEPRPDKVETRFLRDTTRSILATNDSPDVGFDVSINPYRGCEHGCAYCYARTTHEYLGFSAGLDFETRILVKEDAPELLERELGKPGWRPQPIGISGVTDPYQPIERRLEITRGCLAVLARYRNPVILVTKNALVTRDLDHLSDLAAHGAAIVCLSVTTLDGELSRRLEPRASHPRDRLAAIAELEAAGVPCGMLIAPIVPGLTDHELPSIVEAGAKAGVSYASFLTLRLPGAVEELFDAWLARHAPDRRDKVLNRLREFHGGRLNDPRFGHRMRGEGVFYEQIAALFAAACRRHGVGRGRPELSTAAFRRPGGDQMPLFADR